MNRLRSTYFVVANAAILLIVLEIGTHLVLKAYDGLRRPALAL
jgi:hypothetical protein